MLVYYAAIKPTDWQQFLHFAAVQPQFFFNFLAEKKLIALAISKPFMYCSVYMQYVLIHCCCCSYVWQKVSSVKFVRRLMMLFFHLIFLVSFFVAVSFSRLACASFLITSLKHCFYFCEYQIATEVHEKLNTRRS